MHENSSLTSNKIQKIMPCIYFLVFLLALLPPSTLTTAGGGATLEDRTLRSRSRLRGTRSKLLNQPPQPMEIYLEKRLSIDAAAEETSQPEEEVEENPTTGKAASRNSKGMRFEDKTSDYVKVITELKTEEGNKYKTAAAPAPAPSKAKRSNLFDFEEGNKYKTIAASPAPAPSKAKRSNSFDFEEGNKYYKTAAAPSPAPSKAKRSNFYDFEEGNKYKTVSAPAPAPSKAKRSNFFDFEDIN